MKFPWKLKLSFFSTTLKHCFGDHRLHFQIFEEEKNWLNNPIYIYYITAQQTVPCVEIKQEPGTFPSNVKNALLEDQDISPDSFRNILPQTEDQDFLCIEPPISLDDYLFSMDNSEGISDLFDAYDFDIPVPV
jgi:hypothetical protein